MDTFLKAFHVPVTLQQFLNTGNLIDTAAQSHMKIQSSVWRLHGLSWFLPQFKVNWQITHRSECDNECLSL